MSRAYTKTEVSRMIVDHIAMLVRYWENESRTPESKDKLFGLAHSILVMFDGESMLPGFNIIPAPHPDDKQYFIDNDENYFDDTVIVNDDVTLHDMLYKAINE